MLEADVREVERNRRNRDVVEEVVVIVTTATEVAVIIEVKPVHIVEDN